MNMEKALKLIEEAVAILKEEQRKAEREYLMLLPKLDTPECRKVEYKPQRIKEMRRKLIGVEWNVEDFISFYEQEPTKP